MDMVFDIYRALHCSR